MFLIEIEIYIIYIYIFNIIDIKPNVIIDNMYYIICFTSFINNNNILFYLFDFNDIIIEKKNKMIAFYLYNHNKKEILINKFLINF